MKRNIRVKPSLHTVSEIQLGVIADRYAVLFDVGWQLTWYIVEGSGMEGEMNGHVGTNFLSCFELLCALRELGNNCPDKRVMEQLLYQASAYQTGPISPRDYTRRPWPLHLPYTTDVIIVAVISVVCYRKMGNWTALRKLML